MFQTSYTAEEWRTLQFAPLWIFEKTAGIDGRFEKGEEEAARKVLSEWAQFKEPLVQEVLQSVDSSLSSTLERFAADPRRPEAGLKDVADLLDRKATTEQAESFKRTMLSLVGPIARASLKPEYASIKTSMRI